MSRTQFQKCSLSNSGYEAMTKRYRLGAVFALFCLAAPLAVVALPNLAVAKTVGFTMQSFEYDFLNILRDVIEKTASETADVDVEVVDANQDAATQLQQVRDFISKGVAAIIVSPTGGADAVEMGKAAADAKIPLVFVNGRPSSDRLPGDVSIVVSNDLVAGRLQMRMLVEMIGAKGEIAILRGADDHLAAQARTRGFREILASAPDIKVIEEDSAGWDRQTARDIVARWLAAGRRFNAIAANNDEMAIGAILAYQDAGVSLDGVFIGGVDATPDALAEMKAGRMTVTVKQNAEAQGRQALKDALLLASGDKAPLYDWVPFELITPSNLAEYLKD